MFFSNNGSGFKHSLFTEVPVKLGIKHIYSSLYRSHANARIEASQPPTGSYKIVLQNSQQKIKYNGMKY